MIIISLVVDLLSGSCTGQQLSAFEANVWSGFLTLPQETSSEELAPHRGAGVQ